MGSLVLPLLPYYTIVLAFLQSSIEMPPFTAACTILLNLDHAASIEHTSSHFRMSIFHCCTYSHLSSTRTSIAHHCNYPGITNKASQRATSAPSHITHSVFWSSRPAAALLPVATYVATAYTPVFACAGRIVAQSRTTFH